MTRKSRRDRGGSGSISRRTALALLGGGGLLGVTVSGAFDSVRGDRPFDVGVSGDGDARLVIDLENPSGSNGDTLTLLELENQASGSFSDLDVTVTSTGSLGLDVEEPLGPGETFDPGGAVSIVATVSCTEDVTETVDLEIVTSGPNERIEATRSIDVTCRGDFQGPIQVPACDLDSTGSEADVHIGRNDTSDGIAGEYDVYVSGGASVAGDIDVTGTVDLTNGASVSGGVTAGGSITMSGGVEVGGSIVTGSSLTMTNGASIVAGAERIEVCGDFDLGGGPNIEVGEIRVGGDLSNAGPPGVGRHLTTSDGNVFIGGDVDVSGGIKIESSDDIVVNGSIFWDGNMLSTVTGDLVIGGDLIVEQGGVVDVEGDVTVDGAIDMIGNRLESTTGDISASETFTASKGKITVSQAGVIESGGMMTLTGGGVETTGDVRVSGDLDMHAGRMTETGDTIVIAGDLSIGQENGWPRIDADVVIGGDLYKDRGVINGDITYDDVS